MNFNSSSANNSYISSSLASSVSTIFENTSSYLGMESSGPRAFFGDSFYKLSEFYQPIHGYLSCVVCVFGIIANILNIVVLTRKEMASATNAILTGLAVADLLVMIDYIPFSIHTYVRTDQSEEEKYSFGWAIFTLFHAHLSVVCHSISTWLTVILAVWRYTSVSFPTQSKVWCSMANAKLTIGLTYMTVPIVCIPVYLSFTIREREMKLINDPNFIFYTVNWSDIALDNDELLKKINFWVFSVGTKLVPCILLTYMSIALIRVLIEAEKRKQRLKSNLGVHVASPIHSTHDVRGAAAGGPCSVGPSPKSTQNNSGNIHNLNSSDNTATTTTTATTIATLHDVTHVTTNVRSNDDTKCNNNNENSTIMRPNDLLKPTVSTNVSQSSSSPPKDGPSSSGIRSNSVQLVVSSSNLGVKTEVHHSSSNNLLSVPSSSTTGGNTNTISKDDQSSSLQPVLKSASSDQLSTGSSSVIHTSTIRPESAQSVSSTAAFMTSQIVQQSSSNTSGQGTSRGRTSQPRVSIHPSAAQQSQSQSDRTTRMLLAILILFLITEFPSGILALASGIFGEPFFLNVYQPLGEIIDILALINSGINFILYCCMSRLFRKTFCKIFCPASFHIVPNQQQQQNNNNFTHAANPVSQCPIRQHQQIVVNQAPRDANDTGTPTGPNERRKSSNVSNISGLQQLPTTDNLQVQTSVV